MTRSVYRPSRETQAPPLHWFRQETGSYAGKVGNPNHTEARFLVRHQGRNRWRLHDRAALTARRYTTFPTYTECREEARRRVRDEVEARNREDALRRGVGEVGYEYVRGLERRIEDLEQRLEELSDAV